MIPTAPGVTETTLASEPEPTTHMIDSNVTGIANAARKIPTTISLQAQERNDGRKARVRALRRPEDRAALLRLLPELLHLAPEDPADDHAEEHGADGDQHRDHRVLAQVPEAQVERARHREEEVQVDERPGDREEDLLHEVCSEDAGERARGISATHMRSVTNVPMFAGRKLFIDTPTAYAVTIGASFTWPGYAALRIP